jgi:hypothetical protein
MPKHEAEVYNGSDDVGVYKCFVEAMSYPGDTERTEKHKECKRWYSRVLDEVNISNYL